MDISEIREAKMILAQTIGELVGAFSAASDVVVRVRVQPVFVDVTEMGDVEPRRVFSRYQVEVEGEV